MAAPPISAFDAKFQAQPPQAPPTMATGHQPPQAQQELVPGPGMPTAGMVVRASTTEKPAYAAADYSDLMKHLGRYPSYAEVAGGLTVKASGRVRASADGRGQEPILEFAPARDEPLLFGPAQFALAFDGCLNRSLIDGAHSMRDMRGVTETVSQNPGFRG